jgi:hypothetical protein
MGSYSGLHATELDSHANMAVAGSDCTVIATSGRHATVTPFSSNLPSMDMVEIGDVAIAYDDPISLQTYLLVMRNALLIPTMDHNLVPPFLLRLAGLQVDETPKHQLALPTVDNHSIYDSETGMRIHLKLNGIFSYFPTRALTLDEIENWDMFPIVFLTPDGDAWNPHTSHYADNEEAMLDTNGLIVEHGMRPPNTLFSEAELSKLYGEEVTWSRFNDAVDAISLSDEESLGCTLTTKEVVKLNAHQICVQLASLGGSYEPHCFATKATENACVSHAAMAFGSVSKDDDACEIFETRVSVVLATALATIQAVSAGRSKGVSAEHLAKVWCIPHDDAARTLGVTTQSLRHDPDSSLSRNVGTNDRAVRYKKIRSFFFMDTLFVTSAAKSSRGNICAQLFVSDKGFVAFYPMKKQQEVYLAVKQFAKEVGAPEVLVCDPHPAQIKREVREFCTQIGTTLKVLEAETQWANRAELYIGLMKEATRKDMRLSGSPLVLWDYCMERRALIFQITAKKLFQLNGTNPHTLTFGSEADISHICQYGWYEWIYYRDVKTSFPYQKERLGRCLGPAKNEGNAMAQWILKENGKVVPRRTLRRLTPAELSPSNEVESEKRSLFNAAIRNVLGDSVRIPKVIPLDNDATQAFDALWDLDPYEDDDQILPFIPDADLKDAAGKPFDVRSVADALINAEVMLPSGDSMAIAKVVRRGVDDDGRLIGTFNDNPLLNTLLYECEFEDGTTRAYSANTIASNIFMESDADGYSSNLLYEIVDHKSSGEATKMADKYIITRTGTKRMRQTTQGWKFLVQWANGTRQWIDLKVLKESNPVQVAEYVTARDIAEEPAFAWWVPYVLRKRDVIVSAVNTRVRKSSHKYGIDLPTSVRHAIDIDRKNGDTLWQDALSKEMGNVCVAFEILGPNMKAPPGWHKASGHLVFDVKMDFTRKARWVKDGHKTPDSATSSFAGVVSRDSIRIALTHAALLGLPVLGADIRNAYLQAPSSEKHFIICGPEFGIENEGRVALIHRALYGGKVAGRDFWHHLRDCMGQLGFTSSRADPDVWLRLSKRSTGEEYYEYVLLYVDDVLVISENAGNVLRKEIGQHFVLREESIGPPSQYLGGKLREVTLENGNRAWAFGSCQYVQSAVRNVEDHLAKSGEKLPYKAPTPLSSGYRPEIDVSSELGDTEASYFHSLVGVLRWIVELGRVDIDVEVSMMSSHLALPRVGHLKEIYHIFAYLKAHSNTEMVFDPTPVVLDMNLFERQDWSYSPYGCEGLAEELPNNMPKPCGPSMTMRVFVDADHAGDLLTRRSRTGFIVFLNGAPIYWSSKKQTSCETSTFGSEFVAMKQATEYIRGLRYKLRMMGITVDEPAFVFGDNQSVLANTTAPGSTLKKKSNAIAYHFVREGCARDEWRTAYINTDENVADLLTKPLAGPKRTKFVKMLLHHYT